MNLFSLLKKIACLIVLLLNGCFIFFLDDNDGYNYNDNFSCNGSTVYGTPVIYEGETYETVIIGTQTWLNRNLNYDPGIGNSWCYENSPSNCAKYGRLYDWATAMGLDSSCNNNYCINQITIPHRGICPLGYHIPTNTDWNILLCYVDGSNDISGLYYSPTAGKCLKASDGWRENYNGVDTYGLSLIPSDDAGLSGNWWSASEFSNVGAGNRSIYFLYNSISWRETGDKSLGHSVRCLKD